jgi:hypothetical protein
VAARLFDSTRRPFVRPLRRDRREAFEDGDRRVAALERGRKEQRLERRAGLTAAPDRPVELRLAEVPPPDEREDIARLRIDRDQRSLQIRRIEAPETVRDRTFGQIL